MNSTDAVIVFLVILLAVGAATWGPVLVGREAAPDAARGSLPAAGGIKPAAGTAKESYGPPPGNRPARPVADELAGGLSRNSAPRFARERDTDDWGSMVVDTAGGAAVAPGALGVHTAVTRSTAVGPGGASAWRGQARSASSMLHAMERS
jgi:hypothetical protein